MQYPRFVKSSLMAALKDTPVVLLHGPRQSGKTTLARSVGGKKYRYITFDDDTELEAARHDPRGYIEGLSDHCILDEIQKVPELFPSIKLVVDRQRTPGRFLLTGSANILSSSRLNESLAGRIEVISLRPLAQTEIENKKSSFLKNAFSGSIKVSFSDRLGEELVERVISGGFPEPKTRDNPRRRRAWYSNYISVLVKKDIGELSSIQYADEIPNLLKKIANNSACLTNIAALNMGLGFDVKTTKHYVQILRDLFLVDQLPPWFSNRNKRLIKTPKLYLSDTGLLCALAGASKVKLSNDREFFGNITETFVVNDLLRQATWFDDDLEFFHYRNKDQYEIDVVVQNGDDEMIGIEVKLAASVKESDFRGLKHFASQNEKRFVAGYVLYDGERSLSFGNKLMAVPIRSLWS